MRGVIPPGSGKGCTFVLTTPVFAYPRYDVSSDGQQFLMVMSGQEPAPSQLSVVFNWFEELKRLVPTGGSR